MKAFLIDLDNKPGTLADVTEAIAAKGINIENLAGASCGSGGRAVIITNDDAGTRNVLSQAGKTFQELETVEANLAHQQVGSFSKAARRLAEAGVNIEAVLPSGMSGGDVTITFVTNNPAKTREVLAMAATR
jgi:hypothetical protein